MDTREWALHRKDRTYQYVNKNRDPGTRLKVSWPRFSIRSTRTVVKPQIHSPFLQKIPPQWERLRTRWSGHDYLVFAPRNWKLAVAIHGNEFHHGLDSEVSSDGDASRKARWENRFVREHVAKTFAHKAHTPWELHSFMEILIILRSSFPSCNHPAYPDAYIYLPDPHHPVKTQAWVVHIVNCPWVLDLNQDSSRWNKGKCIQCILTARKQMVQTGN